MQEALERVGQLLVILGSARSPRTPKNPFTAQEREALIAGMLREAGVPGERVAFAPVADDPDEARWLAAVREAARSRAKGTSVALIGHIKDDSSYYLRSFPEWPYLPSRVESPLGATEVRRLYFEGDLHDAAKYVPGTVAAFLKEFARTPEFARLQAAAREAASRKERA